MRRNLLFLDTETDGLGWGRRAWEIGGVSVEHVGSTVYVEEFVIHVTDFTPDENSDPEALRIGGYAERFGQKPEGVEYYWEETLAEAMHTMDSFTRDTQIIGSAPWFDTHIIERDMLPLKRIAGEWATEPMTPQWYHRMRDIGSVAAGYFRDNEVGGLDDVARRLGIQIDESTRHTAIGDCRLTMACWEAMMGPVR